MVKRARRLQPFTVHRVGAITRNPYRSSSARKRA